MARKSVSMRSERLRARLKLRAEIMTQEERVDAAVRKAQDEKIKLRNLRASLRSMRGGSRI